MHSRHTAAWIIATLPAAAKKWLRMISDIKGVKSGDEVVLYGKQGDTEVKQDDLQNILGTLLADSYTTWAHSNLRKVVNP